MKIILATGSPYRRSAFTFLGLDFTTESSKIDEQFEGRPEGPEELVKELARLKAEAVARNHKQGIVIGFDSVGWHRGSVLEKPRSREEAFERLRFLSGDAFRFYTGIHMINLSNGRVLTRVVETNISMRELTEQEIRKYLDQDPGFMTYAPGFDPLKNMSSSFAERIEGSYNNFTRGIPLEAIADMLKEVGYDI